MALPPDSHLDEQLRDLREGAGLNITLDSDDLVLSENGTVAAPTPTPVQQTETASAEAEVEAPATDTPDSTLNGSDDIRRSVLSLAGSLVLRAQGEHYASLSEEQVAALSEEEQNALAEVNEAYGNSSDELNALVDRQLEDLKTALLSGQSFENEEARNAAAAAVDVQIDTFRQSFSALNNESGVESVFELANQSFDLALDSNALSDEEQAYARRMDEQRRLLHLRESLAVEGSASAGNFANLAAMLSGANEAPVGSIDQAVSTAHERVSNFMAAAPVSYASNTQRDQQALLVSMAAESEMLYYRDRFAIGSGNALTQSYVATDLVYGTMGAVSGIATTAMETLQAGYEEYKSNSTDTSEMSWGDWISHQVENSGDVIKAAAEQAGVSGPRELEEMLDGLRPRQNDRMMHNISELMVKGNYYYQAHNRAVHPDSPSLVALREQHPAFYQSLLDENDEITYKALSDALLDQTRSMANALTLGRYDRAGDFNLDQLPISLQQVQAGNTLASAVWNGNYPISNEAAAGFRATGDLVDNYTNYDPNSRRRSAEADITEPEHVSEAPSSPSHVPGGLSVSVSVDIRS